MIATTNISLKVPFNEKDQAKALGARWNAEAKHWYVPQGVEAAPFEKWFIQAPAHHAGKVDTQANIVTKQNQPIDDDIDAINAKLRDAYESYED